MPQLHNNKEKARLVLNRAFLFLDRTGDWRHLEVMFDVAAIYHITI
jgi:hypothetical protein